MNARRWSFGVAIGLAAACLLFATPAGAYVYWSAADGDMIGRANLDGTGVDQSFVGAGNPYGVAVDAQYIYWTNGDTNTIGRANLDGTGANQSFITGVSDPRGVTVDAGHIYWTNAGTSTIGRANLDGSGVDQSFISTSNSLGVAVDAQHIYWTNTSTDTIGRANLDGSGVDQSFISATNPYGVTVDAQYIYWTNGVVGTIGRANLDGTGVDQSFITTDVDYPHGVAVDPAHIYWTNTGRNPDTIGRANLDGTGVDQSFIIGLAGLAFPPGVAVDAGPPGTASASAASLDFGTQALFTLGPPQPLTVTNTGHGYLRVRTVKVTGTNRDDFLVSSDDCTGQALAVGANCRVGLRFGPSAMEARSASLQIQSDDPASPLQVPLAGTGGSLPQGPTGPTGPQGPAGPRGRDAKVRCVVKKTKNARRVKVTCKVKLVSGLRGRIRWRLYLRHRLYRHGMTRARHGAAAIHLAGLPRGRYYLRIAGRRGATQIVVG